MTITCRPHPMMAASASSLAPVNRVCTRMAHRTLWQLMAVSRPEEKREVCVSRVVREVCVSRIVRGIGLRQ